MYGSAGRGLIVLDAVHNPHSYLDLLFVHFFDYTTSIPELMHSLNDEVRAGRVNYLGVSDTPGETVPYRSGL